MTHHWSPTRELRTCNYLNPSKCFFTQKIIFFCLLEYFQSDPPFCGVQKITILKKCHFQKMEQFPFQNEINFFSGLLVHYKKRISEIFFQIQKNNKVLGWRWLMLMWKYANGTTIGVLGFHFCFQLLFWQVISLCVFVYRVVCVKILP